MDVHRRKRAQLAAICVALAAVLLALAWRYTPLHDFADPPSLAQRLHALVRTPWAPVAIVLIYLAGNTVMFPNTVLNVATILALGTLPGLPYALLGSLSAALAGYTIGRRYGEDLLQRIDAESVDRVSKAMRRSGVPGVVMLRLLPVAPYSVVNLAAGASRIRAPAFTIGTFLGLLPGALLVTAFGHQLRAALREPSPMTIAAIVAIVLLAAAGAWYVRRLALRP